MTKQEFKTKLVLVSSVVNGLRIMDKLPRLNEVYLVNMLGDLLTTQ